MLIRRNAEGVHGRRKVGNPCSIRTSNPFGILKIVRIAANLLTVVANQKASGCKMYVLW